MRATRIDFYPVASLWPSIFFVISGFIVSLVASCTVAQNQPSPLTLLSAASREFSRFIGF